MVSSLLLRNLVSKLKTSSSFPNSEPKNLSKIATFNRWITTKPTSNKDEEEEEKEGGGWKSEKGEMKGMTMEELEKLPEDTIIHVPKEEIPVRFTVRYNNHPPQPKPKVTTFQQLKEDCFSDPVFANASDWYSRNLMRLNFWNHLQKFVSSLDSAKDVVFLQLILVDEDRDIQGKLYQGLYRQNPGDPDAAQNSKCVFKALVPFLLQNTECWVYSRSLVLREYNRALLDETLLKFISNDPVGGLKDIPFDIPLGTPVSEVSEQQHCLLYKAVEVFKDKHVPLGIHCAEVLMFIAGEFGLDDDGDGCLNSRGAVQEFLCHLMTENGMQKIIGFDEMISGCPIVSPEKIAILKLTE